MAQVGPCTIDGWMVGKSYYPATGKWAYVMYHYDGTSWTVHTTIDNPLSNTSLVSVTAVSSTEAWAVGKLEANTLVMHYASGTWTSAGNLAIPSILTTLTSIASDASNEVWAVGYYSNCNPTCYNTPVTMRWGGQSWVSFTTPYVSGGEPLNGVAVVANTTWTGGTQTPPNSSNNNPIVYAIK